MYTLLDTGFYIYVPDNINDQLREYFYNNLDYLFDEIRIEIPYVEELKSIILEESIIYLMDSRITRFNPTKGKLIVYLSNILKSRTITQSSGLLSFLKGNVDTSSYFFPFYKRISNKAKREYNLNQLV